MVVEPEISQATMALWMYFWDPSDWGTPGAGPPAGSLVLLGVGRVLAGLWLGKEAIAWILG